jgi:hypothetical protein
MAVIALDAFTSYLAQAYGGLSVAAAGPPLPRDPVRSLVTCRVEMPGAPRIREQLDALRTSLQRAPVGLALFECSDVPPREALRHVRSALAERDLAPAFLGYAPDGARDPQRHSVVALLEGASATAARVGPPPDDFRVVAIVPVRNEEDVVAQTLSDLIGQGLEVLLLDDWSTDATVRRARPFLGRGLLGVERDPARGASETYDLRAVLRHVEDVAERSSEASWIVLHDADERRRSPWPGVTLRDAIWRVDQSGYTCVDHVTLNFWPTDDAPFDPDGPDLEQRFLHFEFSAHEGHFHQRRAWKQLGVPVGLRRSAGHDVDLPDRRVYPYKFLLKHYPFRSQANGEAKLRERTRRWNVEERALGWHRQYDQLATQRVVRDPASLLRFDPATFFERYLVERLSGAGVFHDVPPWATPPHW